MISTTSQYALRGLIRLARLEEGSSVGGRQLAKDAKIPANYLSKIFLDLRKAGIVDAVRGIGGGYRLLRRPSEIRLIEIIEIFDLASLRVSCLIGARDRCSDADPCSAHEAWKDIRQNYCDFLEQTTLDQISDSKMPEGDP